jgi:hypothetical protein
VVERPGPTVGMKVGRILQANFEAAETVLWAVADVRDYLTERILAEYRSDVLEHSLHQQDGCEQVSVDASYVDLVAYSNERHDIDAA